MFLSVLSINNYGVIIAEISWWVSFEIRKHCDFNN